MNQKLGRLFFLIGLALYPISVSAQNCAPLVSGYSPPTGPTGTVCINRASTTIPSSTISGAVTMWKNGCSQLGSGIPDLIAEGSLCNITVQVTYSSSPNPQ